MTVLVSSGFCSWQPHTRRHWTTKIFSFRVLGCEIWNQNLQSKTQHSQDPAPCGHQGRLWFASLFWWLPQTLGTWLQNSSLQGQCPMLLSAQCSLLPLCVHSIFLCLSALSIHMTIFRVHLNNPRLICHVNICNLILYSKSLFPVKATFTYSRD